MPERPDLRRIATDIREALGTYPPEALVDILTYVFQAYVVEGAPTVHAPAAERLADLEGLSFADLIQQLQLRLEVPELSLFEVQNGRVSVRVGGELVALMLGTDARRAAAAPLPAAPAVQTASPPQVSAPGPAPRPAAPGTSVEAPRPTRGISVNPQGSPAPRPAAPAGQQAGPAQPGAKPAAPGASTEEPGDDDAASKRFRLLEID
ncbi:MAG TPA: hypothetical protein VKE22_05985 [Haliangiales bacterium]|nr:hypothetical protein [Haliangiales bacterium]